MDSHPADAGHSRRSCPRRAGLFTGSGEEWDSCGVCEAELLKGLSYHPLFYGGYDGRTWRAGHVRTRDFRTFAAPDVQFRAPEQAPVYLEGNEPLKLRVFVDRSVIEVFVNGKQCVAMRVYPGREDSVGVSLLAQGREAMLRSLDAWPMGSVY